MTSWWLFKACQPPYGASFAAANPQLRSAFAADRPDLVLYDITGYPARVLAHQWGVPLIQLSPAIVAWQGFEEDMDEGFGPLYEDPDGQAFFARFAEWLDGQGVPLSVEEFIGHPPRCLVLIPRVMQPHADRVDGSVYTFVGPCLDTRPHQDQWPAPDRPLVLVSLGSAYTDAPRFYRYCFTTRRTRGECASTAGEGDSGHPASGVQLARGLRRRGSAVGGVSRGDARVRWCSPGRGSDRG